MDGDAGDMIIGQAFWDLFKDQAEWSQKTFGTDKVKGPVGSLKHLQLEAKEAEDADDWHSRTVEIADCFLLTLDAARRHGLKPMGLLQAAIDKMAENKLREWPKEFGGDAPIEHVKNDPATGPITPDRVESALQGTFPPEVIRAFDEEIVRCWNGSFSKVLQSDVAALIARYLEIAVGEVFRRGLLNVEPIYRKAGWVVEYDRPGFSEQYRAFFMFAKKDRGE